MSGRGFFFKFAVIVLLLSITIIQILSMMQSDRLFTRLNQIESSINNRVIPVDSENQSKVEQSHDGGWLVWRLGGEPSTLNPYHSQADFSSGTITDGNIFESLLKRDPDTLELKPFLAKSFAVSEDGMEIDFKLRDDIYFSDGVPVTAKDVEFSFKTITNPQIDAAMLANYYQDVKEVQVISGREVKFVMKRKYFKSLEIVGGMAILPEHIYHFDDPHVFNSRISDPVGSGPYVFVKWNVAKNVILIRNESYWGKLPAIKKIVFKFIINDNAAIQSLKSGDVDYVRPLPDQYDQLAKDKAFTSKFYPLSYWHPGVGYFYIGWNEANPCFKDKRVRLALTMLIDREAICKHLLKNPEAKVATGPFYIYGDQTNPDIKPWPYDVERARKLLTQAGWVDTNGNGIIDKDGVEFKFNYMIVGGVSLHENIAKLLKDSFSKVGIEMRVDPYEWSVFIGKLHDRDFDATNLAWGGGLESDPYQVWHSSQIGGGGGNYVGFNNPEADALIEKARETLDRTERDKLYHKFHSILHEQQPYTFIYTRPSQAFLDRRFQNVKLHRLGLDSLEWYVPSYLQKY